MENFIKDCDEFKSKFGDHWDVPLELRELLKRINLFMILKSNLFSFNRNLKIFD